MTINMISMEETAKILGVSRSTVENLKKSGILKASVQVANRYYFAPEHVEFIKATHKFNTSRGKTRPLAKITVSPGIEFQIKYQDVSDSVMKLARTKGRNVAVSLLTQFGSAKLPEIKPEKHAEIMKMAKEWTDVKGVTAIEYARVLMLIDSLRKKDTNFKKLDSYLSMELAPSGSLQFEKLINEIVKYTTGGAA